MIDFDVLRSKLDPNEWHVSDVVEEDVMNGEDAFVWIYRAFFADKGGDADLQVTQHGAAYVVHSFTNLLDLMPVLRIIEEVRQS